MRKAEAKKNWTITSDAFQRLLDWLDAGVKSDGQNYLEMRARLVVYFARKNCLTPDNLADETLNRVARRLEEAGAIESETPAKYCYITARFILMESLRAKKNRHEIPLDDVLRQSPTDSLDASELEKEEREKKEKMLVCLERCIEKLDAANRDIIVSYYFGEERVKIENRRALAGKLGITKNALTIRACRIRDGLEACVSECAGES